MGRLERINSKYNTINGSNLSFREKVEAAFNTKSYEKFPELRNSKKVIDKAYKYYTKSDIEDYNGDLLQKNPKYYLGLLAYHSKYGYKLDEENIVVAAALIKREKEAYDNGNGFFKFLSYLFPNKYRKMRNEIKEATKLLTDKGIKIEMVDRIINNSDRLLEGETSLKFKEVTINNPDFKYAIDEADHFLSEANLDEKTMTKENVEVVNALRELKGSIEKENVYWNDVDAIPEMRKDFKTKANSPKFSFNDSLDDSEDELEIEFENAKDIEKGAFYREDVNLDKELMFDEDKLEIIDEEFGEVEENNESELEDKEVIEELVK